MQLSQQYVYVLRGYIKYIHTNFKNDWSIIFRGLMYANWKNLVSRKTRLKFRKRSGTEWRGVTLIKCV